MVEPVDVEIVVYSGQWSRRWIGSVQAAILRIR
jgi:hypothetical protein